MALLRDAPPVGGGRGVSVQLAIPSPIGNLTLTASGRGLRRIDWGSRNEQEGESPILLESARQLQEYFAGNRRHFDLPLDLEGTPFRLRAWNALAEIPYGTTVGYREQAQRLGFPRAARAVGAANGSNPLPLVLPCHRVVGTNGALTGYGGGLEAKRWLLAHEARQSG
jgi:methylated-DNA-[protein]-cysteine S-methyltransferase